MHVLSFSFASRLSQDKCKDFHLQFYSAWIGNRIFSYQNILDYNKFNIGSRARFLDLAKSCSRDQQKVQKSEIFGSLIVLHFWFQRNFLVGENGFLSIRKEVCR